ncbi:glycosyltransferase family 92 protein [Sharpea azabuensis]|uniref:glycosyltransferase family 92 protein n=1 Tax=Sharpea azabuensis TaxID=322505 RepID=UPI003D035D19
MKKKQNKFFILDRTNELTAKSRFINVICFFVLVFYKIVYVFCRAKDYPKKYNVSVCAIFKNEAAYLKEWIEFNHLIGIEHFYLYNNNSDDDYMEVLDPYIKDGLVTLVQWPKNQAQIESYNHCISQYKDESKWIGFIDIDEFIIPIAKNSIYELLKPFNNKRGAVKLYWRMFGTSGRMKRDMNGLVTEDFTVCWPKYYIVGKCFYNTNFNYDKNYSKNRFLHHSFWTQYKGINLPPVNLEGKVSFKEFDRINTKEQPAQINHYFTKTFEEYKFKRSRGDVFFKINPHDEEYFFLHENENVSVDFTAYKYMIKLKEKMKRI